MKFFRGAYSASVPTPFFSNALIKAAAKEEEEEDEEDTM